MAVKKAKKAVAVPVTPEVVKSPAKPRKKAAAKPAVKLSVAPIIQDSSYVLIDHPSNGETVCGLHYAIRIGSSEHGSVEISFNSGEWQPCRASAGYWWFDWGYYTPGTYKIVARLRNGAGESIAKSPIVKCEVK